MDGIESRSLAKVVPGEEQGQAVLRMLVAILLQLGCLAFSRYVLGLEGPISDNVAGTIIGQILATAFRFLTYERFVFRP